MLAELFRSDSINATNSTLLRNKDFQARAGFGGCSLSTHAPHCMYSTAQPAVIDTHTHPHTHEHKHTRKGTGTRTGTDTRARKHASLKMICDIWCYVNSSHIGTPSSRHDSLKDVALRMYSPCLVVTDASHGTNCLACTRGTLISASLAAASKALNHSTPGQNPPAKALSSKLANTNPTRLRHRAFELCVGGKGHSQASLCNGGSLPRAPGINHSRCKWSFSTLPGIVRVMTVNTKGC